MTEDDIKVADLGLKERLDDSFRPQDDFYSYANAKWLAANPIPDTESRWGSFYVLREKSWRDLRAICEDLVSKTNLKDGTIEQQVRDFYLSGINYDSAEEENLLAVSEVFGLVDAIKHPEELAGLIGRLQRVGVNVPWTIIVDTDDKDSTRHILRLHQGGLSLPDRDYYLENSEKMSSVRASYEEFVRKSFSLIDGFASDADALWESIWNFEHRLAGVCRTNTELRDVEKNYNRFSYLALLKNYPLIDWTSFADNLQWNPDDKITVDQPEFFDFINSLVETESLENWKAYLKWHVFVTFSSRVSERFAKHHFDFFGKVLAGTKEMPPLWKRVVRAMDRSLGEAIGQLYVAEHFPQSSRQQVLDIVEDVREAYGERIRALDWMAEETKAYALKKLDNMKVLIGYPDKWRDYSSLVVTPVSYVRNVIAAEEHETDYYMRRLHEPISRDDWFMTPQTVNAYHDPNRLVICFPAAILQSPFFDPEAHIAENLGGIGAVIGHELTHGFDDQGCLFDAEGNVRTWQTKADQRAFQERAKIISDQADNFEILPGVHLKGGLVLGESIADLGGLEIALHVLKKKEGEDLKKPAKDGLSNGEVYFVNFAACECSEGREELKRQFALIDPHPDSLFRVNGMIEHCDDFHALYATKEGDKLYRAPKDRAKIW